MTLQNNSITRRALESISPLEQEATDTLMLIAAKIDEALKAKGWKAKDLLTAMDRGTPSIVTKWLSGTHNFTVETLVEIENALGIQLIDRKMSPTQSSENGFIVISKEAVARARYISAEELPAISLTESTVQTKVNAQERTRIYPSGSGKPVNEIMEWSWQNETIIA